MERRALSKIFPEWRGREGSTGFLFTRRVGAPLLVLVFAAAIIWSSSQSMKYSLGITKILDAQLAPAGGTKSNVVGAVEGASVVDRYVTKRRGTKWKVWDRRSVLHTDLGGTCNWQAFKPVTHGGKAGKAPVFMCLYPRSEDIYVSGSIEGGGNWGDCHVLTGLLAGTKRDPVYIDIGANIGACVMQVLLTTGATVLAFEPNPRNLFRLTSTLMNLPEELKGRVTLFPVALGDETTLTSIVTSPVNAGNTQVRRSEEEPLKISGGEQGASSGALEARDIPVERVDDLLSPDLNVDVIKMDVQGFECFVVDGMRRIMKNTNTIQFEVDDELLARFVNGKACSGSRLVRKIQDAGFNVTASQGGPVADLTKHSDEQLAKVSFPMQDMFAVRRNA